MKRPYKPIPKDKIGKRIPHPTPAPPQKRVEIDLDKLVEVFDKYIVATGWEKNVGDYIKLKGVTESDYIPLVKAIASARGIIKIKG